MIINDINYLEATNEEVFGGYSKDFSLNVDDTLDVDVDLDFNKNVDIDVNALVNLTMNYIRLHFVS